MSRQLSERETAALRTILHDDPHGSNGLDLVRGIRERLGSISPADVTPAGVHRTAASLCRKNLAWRAGTAKMQWYKITRDGRRALDGDQAGRWIARP